MNTQPEARQTPLPELLDQVPEDIVLGIPGDESVFQSYTNIPIGKLARQAAAELRRLHHNNGIFEITAQPEALRLAEWCETFKHNEMESTAAELRRLHEVNQELLEALKDVCLQFLQRGVTTDPEHPDHVAIKTAEAIIAKATGEQA